MNYLITVDSSNNIVGQYAGADILPAPWIAVSQKQYAAIAAGSMWSGKTVVAPSVPQLTARQELARQAQALILGGLTVTSTSAPALNGTYATDARAQENILGIVCYINANSKFPGTSGTLTWYDIVGNAHVFSSVDEFMAFYTAGLDFVMDCQLVADAGAGKLPSATTTIP